MPLLTVTRDTVFKQKPTASMFLPPEAKWSVKAGQSLEIRYAFRVGQHCWVELHSPLGAVGKIGYFFLPHVQVQLQELRAIWLTNTDSEVLQSQAQITSGLQQLKQLGFNTIYPVVWQRGFTLYPSPVAEAFIGTPVMPNSAFADRDMLAEVVEAAKALDLRVIPWFEYGLAVPPNSQLHKRHPNLISLDQRGQPIRIKSRDGKPDVFVWLNPCHPEVRQFITDLIAEVTVRYQVDGIQLDDHFGFPVELGYDKFTRDLYRAETGKPMPQNFKDAARLKWTTAKMTELLSQIFQAVKRQSASLISLSPNPLAFSKANYAVDWRAWERKGLIEELVLQVYRDSLTSLISEISKSEVMDAQTHIPTAIGLLTGIRTKPISTGTVTQQIQEVRRRNFTGIACFFYETLFYERLSPEKVARSETELKRLFVV